MSFKDIMQEVARNIGIEPPPSVTGTDPDVVKLGQFINDAGAEVARRVDWRSMRKTVALSGTGTAGPYAIGDDFDRLLPGLSVSCGGSPVRGSVTPDEWFSLPSSMGLPRYFFLNSGNLEFYPYPRSTDAVDVQYQTRQWAINGTTPAETLTADDSTAVVSEKLLATGAIWRWRRHVGKDFADEMAEFEAMLTDLAQYDGGVRSP